MEGNILKVVVKEMELYVICKIFFFGIVVICLYIFNKKINV